MQYQNSSMVDNEDGIYDVTDQGEERSHREDPNEYEETYNEPEIEEDTQEIEEDYVPPVEEVEEETVYRTQEDFDNALKRRLKRHERSIARELGGFNTLEEAKEWVEAGRSVSEASGLTPAQIKMKLEESRMQQANTQTGQPTYAPHDNEVKRELAQMRELIESDRVEKTRQTQESEAKKEFGTLYDKYREDILDKVEDTGLSVIDAAAIVLRPKLREVAETKVRAQQQVKRSRKIEGSDESPGGGPIDYNAALTPRQKLTAKKMGRTLESYYKRLKELGEIE